MSEDNGKQKIGECVISEPHSKLSCQSCEICEINKYLT